MRELFVRIVCLVLVATTGCKKDRHIEAENPMGPCSGFKPPTVSNSGMAALGDTVYLLAVTSQQEVDFEWTGPAAFSSSVQQPVLAGIQYHQNGIYSARIKSPICTSSYGSTTVTVKTPCPVLAENTADVDGTVWLFYTNVGCGPLGANLYHGVTATSSYGVLYIQFNSLFAPVEYKIYGISQLPGVDTTLASMRIQENGTDFNATGGSLYVGNDGNSTTFIFCNIDFKSAGGLTRPVSAYLRCG